MRMKGNPGGFRLTLVLCLTGWGLIFVPADVARPVRILVRDALHPGQAGLHAALRQSRDWVMAWGQSVGQPVRGDDERESFRLEKRRPEVPGARRRARGPKL